MRGLEDPVLDGIDDFDRAGERDERNFGVFGDRNDRHGRAGRGAADDGDDFVVLDEAGREGARLVRVAAVVIEDELQRFAVDAAGGIDFFHQHFKRLGFRVAEERGGAGCRYGGADLDLGLGSGCDAQCHQRGECGCRGDFHCVSSLRTLNNEVDHAALGRRHIASRNRLATKAVSVRLALPAGLPPVT